MPHHLEAVPDDEAWDHEAEGYDGDASGVEDAPVARPAWWRWVAVVVIVAMIVAGPVAYALYRLVT